uniref:Centrosomal protein POC5 n=1 Tax=Arion vulgaris TaxID=1028688 RepID=A0A0B7A281_9EUPU
MSNTSKDHSVADDVRNNSPDLHSESSNNLLSARLQEDYSELLRYAVGIPAPDRRTLECSSQAFQPVSQSGGSSARQTPVDLQHEWDSPLKTQGNDGAENVNTNSLYNTQPPKFRSLATTRTLDANVNRDDDDESPPMQTSRISLNAASATFIEPALSCLSGKLDSWLGKLKCDILAEFRHLTVQTLEGQKCAHKKEIKAIICEKQCLEKEMNRLGEMVNTFEQSMSRKDTVIENVTQALGKQRDKVTMAQAFYHAKAEHAETRREKFTESLAAQHNTRRLTEKVMRAWFGLIQKKWKCRLEHACDKKAQDICKQLSMDYEDKIKTLNDEIENLSRKLKCMQCEKEQYALQVKKAFMRGVCALNMETMSAFTQEEAQSSPPTESSDAELEENSNACNINNNLASNYFQKDDLQMKHVPADTTNSAVSNMDGGNYSSLTIVGTGHPQQGKFKPSKGKARPSTAPSVSQSYQAKQWGVSQPLAPPMASVVVERHDPITKTVGKATASRYPKHSTSKSLGSLTKSKHAAHSSVSRSIPLSQVFHTFQPLAGQSEAMTTTSSIKVVE